MASAKERKRKRRDEGTAAAAADDDDDEAARREAKKQRKEAKRLAKERPANGEGDSADRRSRKKARKEAKRKSLAQASEGDRTPPPANSPPVPELSEADRRALEKQQRKEEKRRRKESAKGKELAHHNIPPDSTPSADAYPSAIQRAQPSENPFVSQRAQPSDNPFAAAAAAVPSTSNAGASTSKRTGASTFPPGFDFEATQRHLKRKQASGAMSASDKSLLEAIEKHVSRPSYVAPVRKTPRVAPKGSSSSVEAYLTSGESSGGLVGAKRSAARVSSSKELTVIDATGLTDAECLIEKQYTAQQLKWLQEERRDLKVRWGRFGKEESAAIEKRMVEWEQENDMDRDTTISLIFDREKREASAYVGLIKALTSAVPHRSFDTVRRFVRLHYHPLSRQGAWTDDEVKKLREAVAKYGNDWAKASAIVGRSRSDCRLFMRDQKGKVEALGPAAKGKASATPGKKAMGSEEKEEDELESDVEESMSHSQRQASRRLWTEQETERFKEVVASLSGTPEAKGRQPADGKFPWKLVAERMPTSRAPNKLQTRWQTLQAREARQGLSATPAPVAAEEEGEDEELNSPKGQYNYARDDCLFVKSLAKAKEAIEFDDIAAVDWKRVAEDMKLPNNRLRQIYTRLVKQFLGEERIHSSFKAVLADLKAPTKAAREAYLKEQAPDAVKQRKPDVEARKREKNRDKARRRRERERLAKLSQVENGSAASPGRAKGKGRAAEMEDLIDSEEEER